MAAVLVALAASACEAIESDETPATTTTERLEVLDVTVTTRPGVIPRDATTGSSILRVAQRSSATMVTTTTTSSTTTSTTTTTPARPLVPFPAVPLLTIFEAAEKKAVHVVSDPYTIDPDGCEGIIWTVGGTDWSAFVVTSATADGYCEIWLGGQTENPDYTGNPFLYCLLPEEHDPVKVASDANSDWVAEPGLCAPTGFDQG